MLEHSELTVLLAGKNDPKWICNIPERARSALGLITGAVYLSSGTARHILAGHNDIDEVQILLLPVVIQNGRIMREKKNENVLNFAYYDHDKKIYFVSLKAVGNYELWVQSMYRLTERKLGKKIAKSHDV